MQILSFTALIEVDEDSGLYVGSVPQLPGAHSEAETLDELKANLEVAVRLALDEMRARGEEPEHTQFVGTQLIRIVA
jgi:predicted RNase H-like HicB family nuclease